MATLASPRGRASDVAQNIPHALAWDDGQACRRGVPIFLAILTDPHENAATDAAIASIKEPMGA